MSIYLDIISEEINKINSLIQHQEEQILELTAINEKLKADNEHLKQVIDEREYY